MANIRLISHWCYLFVFLAGGIFFAWSAGSLLAVFGFPGIVDSDMAGRAFISAVLSILCFIQVAVLITAYRRKWRNVL